LLGAALLSLTCSACSLFGVAPTPDIPPQPAPVPQVSEAEQRARGIWQRFASRAVLGGNINGPFRINAALRYSDPQTKNTRVNALLWGNGMRNQPWPLRLDIRAGIGTVVVKAEEKRDSLTAYIPDENTAYVKSGDDRGLTSFGVPIPMDLADLAMMLSGRPGALFMPFDGGATMPAWRESGKANMEFQLQDSRLPGILTLSPDGLPLAWREESGEGWSMALEYAENDPEQLERLRIEHPKGYSALVVLKEIKRLPAPFSAAQMSLALPPGAGKKIVTN
jgi:hypothetical protein